MSRSRLALLLAPLAATAAIAAAAAPAAPPSHAAGTSAPAPPPPIVLADGWRFRLDRADAGLAAGWQRTQIAPGGWRSVSVPHVFDPRPLARLFRGTVGWYRLRFATPATPPDFGWAIHFDQARRVASVWLNGRLIGTNTDPYGPFQLALPPLAPNAMNELVVRVDNRKGIQPREGWWNWGGLTRPVSLVPLGPVALSDLGVLPRVECSAPGVCGGSAVIDAVVTNRSPRSQTPSFTLTLTPPDGAAPQIANVSAPSLAPGESRHVSLAVPLTQPLRLWSPGHGLLYGAQLQTFAGGTLAEVDSSRVGMRQVSVRDGVLYVNDRAVQLRGASVEEDVPGRGPALSGADATRIVAQLRLLHADVTRSQYPLDPVLLDKLDRAGILVWTQAPIYHRDALLQTPGERADALSTLAATVLATRTHPSVMTESVANELTPVPDGEPAARAYIDAAVPLVRRLDPGTPVSIDILSYPGYPAQRTYDQFDMLGINDYFGWYTGPRGPHSTASLAALAPFLRAAHAAYPRQALIVSEFGAEANVAGPADVKQTYAFQTAYLERTLRTIAALPFMNGAIYWTLREFAVKPHWDGGAHRADVPRTSIHHKGLISYGGTPKPAFWAAASLYAHTPVYRVPPVLPVPPPSGGAPRGPASPAPAYTLMLGLLALALSLGATRVAGVRRQRRTAPDMDALAP